MDTWHIVSNAISVPLPYNLDSNCRMQDIRHMIQCYGEPLFFIKFDRDAENKNTKHLNSYNLGSNYHNALNDCTVYCRDIIFQGYCCLLIEAIKF